MKILPRRLLAALTLAAALVVAAGVVALGVVSLPRHPERPTEPARVVGSARGEAGFSAGAAEVPFTLPAGVPIAGFPRMYYRSEGLREPLGARAIVLSAGGCKVALVSAEILLVPESLVDAVAARITDLNLSGLVLAATHTHAGPGGYWESEPGERIATGRYDAHVRDAVAGTVAQAIREAAAKLAPARVAVGRGEARELVRSRSGGDVDGKLSVIRVERADGAPVAELAVFAAHPTILGKANRLLSGDWAGRFEGRGTHGLRLLMQGPVGDQSVSGPASASPESYGDALSRAVDGLRFGPPDPSPHLAFAAAEAVLPAPSPVVPPFLSRAARNVAYEALPARARVSVVRIGPALLVTFPGEPVAAVTSSWRSALPEGADVVSLANGYVGYVETAEHVLARTGEAKRTYYGPELARRLGDAARAAVDAVAAPRR